MFDQNIYDQLKHGEERYKYLKKVIAEEDAAHNYKEAFDLRFEYITESIMYDDEFKGFIMFPEFMAYYDAHSDVCDQHSLMWAFKWIIGNVEEFYQISCEKIEEYFEEFRKRCVEYGISLRTYYMKKMNFYSYMNIEKMKECQVRFRKLERDRLSDCAACEMNTDIRMELRYGSEKKAMEMVADMLKRGVSCAEIPETTFGECVYHFTRTGNIAEAEYYAEMMMPMIKGRENNFLKEISNVLLLKALTAPNEAYDIFKRSINVFLESKNPEMRFYFANAAAVFFNAAISNDRKKIVIKLPHSFPLYNDENEYELEKMRDYFGGIAKDIADKFDARNGSDYFNDLINFEYPNEPTGELYLPAHSIIPVEPAAIAVLFKNPDSVPELQELIDRFSALPDTEISGVSFDKENGVLSIITENSAVDEEIIFALFFRELNDIADLSPVHYIADEKIEEIENYEAMIVITCKFIKNQEMYCYNLLLAAADAINTDAAPVFADLENNKLISADWVGIQAKDAMPVPERYLYKIEVFRSDEGEELFDMFTTGLAQFGSRNIAVLGLRESELDFAGNIVAQIAKFVIGVRKMSDEGVPMQFGVIYNEESNIQFSWKPAKIVYPEYAEMPLGEYAVPLLHSAENDEGIYINDFPEEDREKLTFRESNSHHANNERCARERFGYALDALRKNDSELLVGLELPMPEEFQEEFDDDKAYVYVYLDKNGETGVIDHGYDKIEQYAAGKTLHIDPQTVFHWRLLMNGDYYFADDSYLLI